MNYLSPLVNVLNKSIRNSGKKLIRDFSEIEKLQSSIKNIDKYTTISISNLEKDICDFLGKIKPNLAIHRNHNIEDDDCWIINPIDSRRNFSRGIDNFFITISLRERKKITTSIFYNPIKDENYYFQKGMGGYRNDSRIRVSEKKKLYESIFTFYNNENHKDENKVLGQLRALLKKKHFETRESGSIYCDLCFLGSGKIDCILLYNPLLTLKEVSYLILSETGGVLTETIFLGKKIYIASNKSIGKLIKEMIENKYEKY